MDLIGFSKLSGSGNDFVVIDNRDATLDGSNCADFVRKVCRRALSVGADGVILIENDPNGECDFSWRYFNSDGSEAEMCGNGGRCAARFAHEKGIAGRKMSFRTKAGVISANITGERTVRLQMVPPKNYDPEVLLEFQNHWMDLKYLEMGVPHVVLEVNDLEDLDVAGLGAGIRYHKRFAPAGANANFVQVTGPHSVSIRTYERGVEGETLACGTGCVASAIVMSMAGKVRPPVQFATRSKEVLTVTFEEGSSLPTEVFFEGAVSWIYDGVLRPESLL